MSRRDAAYRMMDLFGANRAARIAFRRRLLVLAYHGVCADDASAIGDSGHVPTRLFEAQLRFLTAEYRPVSLAEVRAHYLEGAPLPPRAMLVTFDDCYRNVASNAMPVLRELGVPCVLFPVTGATESGGLLWQSIVTQHFGHERYASVKRRLYTMSASRRRGWILENVPTSEARISDHTLMTWNDLRALAASPAVAIGSHCVSHEPLTSCDAGEVDHELRDSRTALRERLGIDSDVLCYPDGSYSPLVLDAAKRAGYRIGFTTDGRHASLADDPLAIPRILVGRADEPQVLAARVAGWLEWLRPLVRAGRPRPHEPGRLSAARQPATG